MDRRGYGGPLEDGESVGAVVNTNVDPLCHARRMGDILTSATATLTGATVSDAYEVAKAGGKHAGFLKQYSSLPDHLLEKAARGFEKQIAAHNRWIENPFLKLPPDYPLREVKRLVTQKWPSDIARLEEQKTIALKMLKERNR